MSKPSKIKRLSPPKSASGKIGNTNINGINGNTNNKLKTKTTLNTNKPQSPFKVRTNDKFNAVVTSSNNSKLITGTSTVNPNIPQTDKSVNKNQPLIIHQSKEPFDVDLEFGNNKNDANYQSIHENINVGTSDVEVTAHGFESMPVDFGDGTNTGTGAETSPCFYASLTNSQIWALFGIVAFMGILTVVLYLMGYGAQLKIIWNKIFCLLGLMKCT